MSNNEINNWNKKYREKRFFLKWPDEMIVRFIAKYMNVSRKTSKVLDLGCGSGRHSELLANSGCQVFGCDVSKTSIEITKKRLKLVGLKGDFVDASSWDLPYESNFFNFVIAWHSIYYNSFENMKKTISEINRVLVNRGIFIATFIASGDFRQCHGKLISKNTYVGKKDAYDHTGLTVCISDLKTIKKLLSKNSFTIISQGYHEMYFDPVQRTCHWIIIAKKDNNSS